jgi:hypothetical protein
MCYPPMKLEIKNPFPDLYVYIKSFFVNKNEEPKEIELREILIHPNSTFEFTEEYIYDEPEPLMSPGEVDKALDFLNSIDDEYDIVDSIDS